MYSSDYRILAGSNSSRTPPPVQTFVSTAHLHRTPFAVRTPRLSSRCSLQPLHIGRIGAVRMCIRSRLDCCCRHNTCRGRSSMSQARRMAWLRDIQCIHTHSIFRSMWQRSLLQCMLLSRCLVWSVFADDRSRIVATHQWAWMTLQETHLNAATCQSSSYSQSFAGI